MTKNETYVYRIIISISLIFIHIFLAACSENKKEKSKIVKSDKNITVSGVATNMSLDEMNKIYVGEISPYSEALHGLGKFMSYYYNNKEVDKGVYQFLAIKSPLNETVSFSWEMRVDPDITIDQAIEDIEKNFAEFGDPVIFKDKPPYVSSATIIYGIKENRDEFDYSYGCVGDRFTLCIKLRKHYDRSSQKDRFEISGLWGGRVASQNFDLWLEQKRPKVKF
jgi:hypothetical protein